MHQALQAKKSLFEKSDAKTFVTQCRDCRTPMAQINRSLFASFSSEKEVLSPT
jgi:hypothetical protein